MQYALLPIPERLTGGTRAELFFYQVGEPPRYQTDQEGNVVQDLPTIIEKVAPKKDGQIVFPVARVNNRPVDFGMVMNADTIESSLRSGNFRDVLIAAAAFGPPRCHTFGTFSERARECLSKLSEAERTLFAV